MVRKPAHNTQLNRARQPGASHLAATTSVEVNSRKFGKWLQGASGDRSQLLAAQVVQHAREKIRGASTRKKRGSSTGQCVMARYNNSLRRLGKTRGLTRPRLAARTSISRCLLRAAESGQTASLDTTEILANALAVSVEQITTPDSRDAT